VCLLRWLDVCDVALCTLYSTLVCAWLLTWITGTGHVYCNCDLCSKATCQKQLALSFSVQKRYKNYSRLFFCLSQLKIVIFYTVVACVTSNYSQARTQISYRPITLYSVDSLLFLTSCRRRHFDLSPLAVAYNGLLRGCVY